MAVAPMFIVDMTTLQTALKLDGIALAGSVAEFNTAVQAVSVGFYRRLGATRIAQILAMAYTDSPVTDNDFTRLMANLTEIAWSRQKLLRVKPTLFADASGKAQQLFNDEGAFRPNSQKSIDTEIKRLSAEIEDGLIALTTGIATPETEINVMTIGPKHQNDMPGAMAFPWRRRVVGHPQLSWDIKRREDDSSRKPEPSIAASVTSGGFMQLVADYAMSVNADPNGKTFSNSGASGGVNVTLPLNPQLNTRYTFLVEAAQQLLIQANPGVRIQLGQNTSSAGGFVESSISGSALTLVWTGSVWFANDTQEQWSIDQ